MRRREVIAGLSAVGGAAAWPLRVGAQTERTRRIAVLMSWAAGDPESLVRLAAFRDGLQKLGWREGHNLRLDIRWATSDTGLTRYFAKELVALQPDIILSPTTATTGALLQHTRAIPVIFVAVSDPVGSGFVSKFSEPGGNVTGFINVEPTMAGKWLELLKEIAPRVERVAYERGVIRALLTDAQQFEPLRTERTAWSAKVWRSSIWLSKNLGKPREA